MNPSPVCGVCPRTYPPATAWRAFRTSRSLHRLARPSIRQRRQTQHQRRPLTRPWSAAPRTDSRGPWPATGTRAIRRAERLLKEASPNSSSRVHVTITSTITPTAAESWGRSSAARRDLRRGENLSYTALTSRTTYRVIGIGRLRSKPTRHQSTRHRRVCCLEPPRPGALSMSASIRGRLLPSVADDAFRVVCGDWRRPGTQPSRPGTSVTIAPAAMIATTRSRTRGRWE